MRRKTQFTLETEELVSIKARRSFTGFCKLCRAQVEMLTAETAAALSGLSERGIFRSIENGELHFVEAERVFICRDSLESCAEIIKAKRRN